MELLKARQSLEKKSHFCLKTAVTNPLRLVKFKLFTQAAKVLITFLVTYQTRKPMVLFLALSLEEIIHFFNSFNLVFLLRDTLDTANTLLRLLKVNLKDRAIHKHGAYVNPGIELKIELAVTPKL